ncbi:MAG TPA: DUF4124 domain-containing protein [Vicinamibacterales bacterium]|nr:DUF4124 domain-containing protein [Rhodanobacteraceae bacterium]HVZ19421.1 DUF4124 domain-containing protein [Vicinamibacterales bacterium]
MKASHILLLVTAIAGAGALVWRFRPDWLPDLVAKRLPASPVEAPPLYKWRDARGRLNVTSTPPADRPYEVVRYDPKTNVVPSGSTPR